jgi:AraC-like DNA-binding protein/ligand-binding sensor protein
MNVVPTPSPASPLLAGLNGDDVVSRLQHSEIFRDYREAFETATGLPLVLRAVGAFDAPLHGSKQTASFCNLMAAGERACAACMQQQAEVEAGGVTDCKTVTCPAGLCESVVPIRIGETVIAYLQTGQVLLRPPTKRSYGEAMARLAKWKPTINAATLETAYFETRVLTKSRYQAVLRLLSSFAQHLSMISNELMIKSAASEPPAVAKARAFISQHLAEPLSLEQVARAANMSAFYFCKVFKSATGLTFTHYIARARVERTKQLLLNPHTRISEAAYEAGFQSLSQFNRVFRRVVGEAPTTYRERLHQPATESMGHHRIGRAA